LALGENADFEALNYLPALNLLFCQTPAMPSLFFSVSIICRYDVNILRTFLNSS